MKICYIAPLNSTHTHKWIKYFNSLGYEIYCVGNEQILNKIEGVTYYSFYEKIKNNKILKLPLFKLFFYTIYGLKIIKKINPNITHLHFIGFSSLIPLLYKNKNLITTVWGTDVLILPKKIPFYKFIVKKILLKSNIITYDGNNMLKELKKYKIQKSKLKEIGFGIDTKIFKKLDLNKKNKIFQIISLRNLEKIYDIKTLLYTTKSLINKGYHNFEINIYGNGREKENLLNLSNKLNINKYVNFKGKYKHSNLTNILNNNDIYISTSLSDSGLACSTAEAMACGLPVIVTNTSDNNKWIINKKNGFIFEKENSNDLGNKILYFLKNKDKIEKMGKNNIEKIFNKKNLSKEMNKVNILYNNI